MAARSGFLLTADRGDGEKEGLVDGEKTAEEILEAAAQGGPEADANRMLAWSWLHHGDHDPAQDRVQRRPGGSFPRRSAGGSTLLSGVAGTRAELSKGRKGKPGPERRRARGGPPAARGRARGRRQRGGGCAAPFLVSASVDTQRHCGSRCRSSRIQERNLFSTPGRTGLPAQGEIAKIRWVFFPGSCDSCRLPG